MILQCKECNDKCTIITEDADIPTQCPWSGQDANWKDITRETEDEGKILTEIITNSMLNMSIKLGAMK